MPIFKAFPHLARLTKSALHATPGAAVAGQQSLGSLHNHVPIGKFSKASHLQHTFSTASNQTGAKTGHATSTIASDANLDRYLNALHQYEQTGDDTEFAKQQWSRKIQFKNAEKAQQSKIPHRLPSTDITKTLLRLNSKVASDPARKTDSDLLEAEALKKIDEAIAQEVASVQAARNVTSHAAIAVAEEAPDADETRIEWADDVELPRNISPVHIAPLSDLALSQSEAIIELGQQAQYADIPYRFQSMVQQGLVPTVQAYNYIIKSAIELAAGYQPLPRAVDIYNDMTSKGVSPDEDTYRILVGFLSAQSLEAAKVQIEIKQHMIRYGQGQMPFMFSSLRSLQQLYADDVSILMAIKFYKIARRELAGFRLNDAQYAIFLQAYQTSGSPSDTAVSIQDMHKQQLISAPETCVAAIESCVLTEDLEGAKEIYQQYRDLAISRNTTDALDNTAYVALMKTYFSCGQVEEGFRFYERILQSYETSEKVVELSAALTDAFVVDCVLRHYIAAGDLHKALEAVGGHVLSKPAHARAVNTILAAAADSNQPGFVAASMQKVASAEITSETVMAISAMHFRAGRVVEARNFWARYPYTGNVSFATLYGMAILSSGHIEEALFEVTRLFRQIRASFAESARSSGNIRLDESVQLFGQTLAQGNMIYSSQAAVLLFRLMIENGGLVPSIAQAAMARVGPECVEQLAEQDIALALHVQAYMLPPQEPSSISSAQHARFAHLLQTVLDRKIGMDPATVYAVDKALPLLGSLSTDLESRWQEWKSPVLTPKTPLTPTTPLTPRSINSSVDSFDPYAHTIDHRASRAICDMLDNGSTHAGTSIGEAMNRLKNVRRIGRHLQYGAYAKLLTAAGKAHRKELMHELISMAQHDVPFNADIPAVKAGWVTIYDSMVAACLGVGERDLANKYHNELLSIGATPSANTFGIYITTLADTYDEASSAVEIFQRAQSEGVIPTVFLFNALIGKLGKARRIDDCLQYFAQMQALNLRPSSVTYGTLVNALCRTSEESFAIEMFDEMEAAPNYRPRPAPYNSMIQYFLNTKRDRSKVLQYFSRMRGKHIKPTSHTYKLLIESYASLEPINLPAAEAVLNDMRADGVLPEAVHYGSLIHAKGCVLSDMAGAKAMFNAVLADPSVRPTDNLYQNLLEAMVANHDVTSTDEILSDMKARNIMVTPYIANTLIHGWAGAGDIARAKSIYETLGKDKREPSTYEAMTRAFLAVNDHAAADEVVREMLGKGYPSAVADKVLALTGSQA